MTEIKERVATPEPPPELPALGLVGWLRWTWRQLTSMKTALVLLFLLALGAVPGSLIPQTGVDPIGVADFLEANPKLGPFYDKLGLFDVYKSAWFSAIYLLLFISLIGCVVPRLGVYLKAVRARPPQPPRNLHKLAAYETYDADSADGVLEAATRELKRRRYRVEQYDGAVAAERGYLREAGNLLFHFSLILALLGVAWGSLFGYRGTVLVVEGNGFSNSVAQYDDFTSGQAFTGDDDLPPFSLTVQNFAVKFQESGPQRGAAREFNAALTYQESPDGPEKSYDLRVNHPLKLDGSSVYLLGHGYAPKVTVKDGDGKVAFSGPAPFLPQDGNFSSFGVIKAPDARPLALGFEGFFLPTAVIDERGPRSVFPDDLDPALAMTAYYGRPQKETGKPESVYQLDKTKLTQFENGDDKLRFQLQPGDSFTLPDKAGSITFDGYSAWVKIQISHTPGTDVALGGIMLAILGLMGSLFVHPRRTWVRVRTQDGRTVVEIAGLDRGADRGVAGELRTLAKTLTSTTQEKP
ncbi:cytochrome c biogenesis protein ResB [Kribbella sandramycini]|uniref:Cytochrome c biogenesis protein n=1 Tax=Kribbella sandramycini TaxID=60450 RepID=A0A7Y4P139_9ACTN|nr:cytochrome c biogenesis protein ResB [Kribbella sandramycini]MBB6564845.1 cytochrome c biogenesis protein [Kribbella sandramycini]NOL42543.1 cytochrome c biogenesis protein ResB [Kribbella sandramycini]